MVTISMTDMVNNIVFTISFMKRFEKNPMNISKDNIALSKKLYFFLFSAPPFGNYKLNIKLVWVIL